MILSPYIINTVLKNLCFFFFFFFLHSVLFQYAITLFTIICHAYKTLKTETMVKRDWQRMKGFQLIMFPNCQTGDINLHFSCWSPPLWDPHCMKFPWAQGHSQINWSSKALMINKDRHTWITELPSLNSRPLHTSRPLLCVQTSDAWCIYRCLFVVEGCWWVLDTTAASSNSWSTVARCST